MSEAWESIGRALSRARRTGYRALIVRGGDRLRSVERLAGEASGDCALIGDSKVRRGFCRLELSPARYREVLGSEYGAVIVSLESMVRPSIVAASGEAVRGGGFLALAGPPWEDWSLGPRDGPGHYKAYLERMIPRSRLHSWTSGERVISEALEVAGSPGRGRARFKSRAGIPGAIMRLARTASQARALDEILLWMRGPSRSLLVAGDRGRGKSFTIGLGLAVGIKFKHVGNAAVVGPSPWSVGQVFRGLKTGLDALGIRYRERTSGGETVRISGPWFRVAYEPPDRRLQEPLVVVDEAAAVGPARVRRLSWRAAKTIVSTTIHGYEGSGRSLALLMEKWLPKPVTRVELEEPIRYPPGDPLEEWLYDTFMLRPDPPPAELREEPKYRLIPREELARNYKALRSVYTILAQAHYRTTPDSLLLLLEAEHHTVHVLESGGDVVAVAELVDEEAGGEQARLAGPRLELMSGSPPGRTVRVSRIAVSPGLQRRGLGSRLLRTAEDWARRRGFRVAASIFSRHEVVRFWTRNGYRPFYASPRYNRVTGEKNLGFAKPLSPDEEDLVARAHCGFTRRLILLSPSIYRDLDAETVLGLLEPSPRCPSMTLGVTPGERRRLELFLAGRIGYEQAMDAIWLELANRILRGSWPPHASKTALLLVAARIIQGKPLDDAARIAGVSLGEAVQRLEEALRSMLGGPLGGKGPGEVSPKGI